MESLLGRTVVLDLVDDKQPDGREHSMSIKVWTPAGTPVADLTATAQQLALDFLERAVLAMRKEVKPIAEQTYWRPSYEEASVVEASPRGRVRTPA